MLTHVSEFIFMCLLFLLSHLFPDICSITAWKQKAYKEVQVLRIRLQKHLGQGKFNRYSGYILKKQILGVKCFLNTFEQHKLLPFNHFASLQICSVNIFP